MISQYKSIFRPVLFLVFSVLYFILPAQKINWKTGDKWYFELLWTIDSPELRSKKNLPVSVLAYPVFTIIREENDGFVLSVKCDSSKVVSGPTGIKKSNSLMQYEPEFQFKTDSRGSFVKLINEDSVEQQLLQLFKNDYNLRDAEKLMEEIKKFAKWQEALFLREYDFIFDVFGHDLKPDIETPISSSGKKFYHLYNRVPMDVSVYDSIIGVPTIMERKMKLSKKKDKFLIETSGSYTNPTFTYKMGESSSVRFDKKEGYYRASGFYDKKSGRFYEGEMVFGTKGGKSVLYFQTGDSTDIPEQLIEERRKFTSITPDPKKEIKVAEEPPGIRLPVFPSYKDVVYYFYQNYKDMSDPKFKLSKHPDGYRITRLRDNSLPMFEPELIWSVQNGWQKVDNFSKREPIDPNDPESVVAVYNPYEWKESADYYLSKNKSFRDECDAQPTCGYPGYYQEIIKILEPDFDKLNNIQLNILARAYSSAAVGLLSNQYGDADSSVMFSIPSGQNVLTKDQLEKYNNLKTKAIDTYLKIEKLNPSFPTPVGTVRTKYANEVMAHLLTLRYFQNEVIARKVIRSGLYDDFIGQSAKNLLASCPRDAILVTYGDNDTYPLLYVQETEKFRTDVLVANYSLLMIPRYYQHLLKGVGGTKPLKTLLPESFFERLVILEFDDDAGIIPAKHNSVDFLKSLKNFKQIDSGLGYNLIKLTKRELILPDAGSSNKINNSGSSEVILNFQGDYLMYNQLALTDIVTANQWSRPLCFSNTCHSEVYKPWDSYITQEGLINRVFPYLIPKIITNSIPVSADVGFSLWKNTFGYNFSDSPFLTEHLAFYQSQILSACNLSAHLKSLNRCHEAVIILDILSNKYTENMYLKDGMWLKVIEIYAGCGQKEKAEAIGINIWDNLVKQKIDKDQPERRKSVLLDLRRLASQFGLQKLTDLK
ncbi:MAG: hypothetical protein IPL63_16435 [Saprospiraceae bacterium]|nr:hypothetical protein [Saprospiraceae bacterium]